MIQSTLDYCKIQTHNPLPTTSAGADLGGGCRGCAGGGPPPPKKNPGCAPVRSHGTKTTRLGTVCSVVGQTGLPSKTVIYVTCGSPLLHVKESKTFWYSGFQSMYFRILNTGFQSLSAELGFLSCIPDSEAHDSGIPQAKFSGVRILLAKFPGSLTWSSPAARAALGSLKN